MHILDTQVRAHSAPFLQLIIPRVVLDELDGLKNSERALRHASVGQTARHASRWILDTVQRQKSQSRPKQQWPLHVQVAAAAADASNDEQIVALCADLAPRIFGHVYMVTDDVNARIRAEAVSVATIPLTAVSAALKARGNISNDLVMLSSFPETRDIVCQEEAICSMSTQFWTEIAHVWGSTFARLDQAMEE